MRFFLFILLAAQWLFTTDTTAQISSNKTGAIHSLMAWRVEKDSKLVINGKSNIMGIACDNVKFARIDTVHIERNAVGDSIPLKGKLTLDVIDFNCHNFFFTSSLRKTLKAEKYPYMIVKFVQLDRIPPISDGNVCEVNGVVEISLAGVTRSFKLPIKFSQLTKGKTMLTGSRMFRLQDFDLQAPVKAYGLIKVKNEFVVDFQLAMTRIH